MRNLEIEAKRALFIGTNFKGSNTVVESINFSHIGTVSKYYLHGNCIAEYVHSTKVLKLDDCGWQSNTTKSRINSLLSYGTYITQKAWSWYITSGGTTEQWDGYKAIQL